MQASFCKSRLASAYKRSDIDVAYNNILNGNLNKEYLKKYINDLFKITNEKQIDFLIWILNYINEEEFIIDNLTEIIKQISKGKIKYEIFKKIIYYFTQNRNDKIIIDTLYKFEFENFENDEYILEKFEIIGCYNSEKTNTYYYSIGLYDKIKCFYLSEEKKYPIYYFRKNKLDLDTQKIIDLLSISQGEEMCVNQIKKEIKNELIKIINIFQDKLLEKDDICLICHENPKYFYSCKNNHYICIACFKKYKNDKCCICKTEIEKIFYENQEILTI